MNEMKVSMLCTGNMNGQSHPGKYEFSVSAELGTDYDVYIIDESGIIIETTYGPELGMGF